VKGGDGIVNENLTKTKVRVIKKDIAVFAVFLFISFILWYLNSLGKESEAGINYQIKYINLPKERIINSELPAELNLYLKGPGYSILKLKISGNKTPLDIDISKVNYKRSPEGKTTDYYIVTSGLAKSLNVQMRSGCEIISIKPDTLFFTLDKAVKGSTLFPGNKTDWKKKR
jgi:hypothetical protein